MTAVDLFPRHAVRLFPAAGRLRPGLWQVLALLMFLGGFVADIACYLPDLIDDLTVNADAVRAPRATIGEGGRCHSRDGLTDCDFEAIYLVGDQRLTRQLHYLAFFDDLSGEAPITVDYRRNDPLHVSTSWGRRLLINRIVTQVVIVAFILALIIWQAVEFRFRLRAARAAATIGAAPHPLAARFLKVAPKRGYADIRFAWTDPADGSEKQAVTRMPRGMQPFWLDAAKQTMLALVRPGGDGLLLDRRLRTVELTEAERTALLRAAPAVA